MAAAPSIRRILVALDASPASLTAAEAASGLAALLEAELEGLFVEDTDFVDLGRSAHAREVDPTTGAHRPLDGREIEHQLRLQRERARRALARIAERGGVSWSFRTVRGTIATELAAAAGTSDLVSLGRFGYTVRERRHLGQAARALLSRRHGRTLLLERRMQLEPPVVVVFDGSEAGGEALELAQLLVRVVGGPLHLVLVGDDREAIEGLAAERRTAGDSATTRWLGGPDGAGLSRAVAWDRAGVVVAPVGGPYLSEEHILGLLHATRSPVLLVS